MKRFISITEKFLDEKMFNVFKTFATETNLYDQNINNTVWNQRVVFIGQVPELKELGNQFIDLVYNKIKIDFEIQEEIYTDILCFNRWRVGDMQHPHADEANGFEWRKFGCVFYLNEEYEGGEIYFPNQNQSIKPKENTLAFFPGDHEFLHGVRPITNGIRYTLSTFWTYDKFRSIKK